MRARSLLLSSSVLALTAGLLFACGDKDDDTGGDDGGDDTTDTTDTTDTDADTDADTDTDGTTDAVDADGDGFDETVDCDDSNAAINPGADEVCDDIDNDCDDLIDDADPGLSADSTSIFFSDGDGDGIGSDRETVLACSAPSGFSETVGDCDDGDATIYPGADEVCDDRIDQNCNLVLDCDDSSCGGDSACVAIIDEIVPPVGATGFDVNLVLRGSGFAWDTAGETTVTVGGVTCGDVIVLDDTQVACSLPAATDTGTVDVVLSNDNGDVTVTDGFEWVDCIYGAQGSGGVPGNLYCIVPTSGSVLNLGALDYAVTGLAAGADGYLYATEATGRGSEAALLKIDPSSLETTEIGNLTDSVEGGTHGSIPDIAFTGSTLVGWTEISMNSSYDDMVTIDTSTGVVTQFVTSFTSSGNTGMGVDPDGTVYLFPYGTYDGASVYEMDVSTGEGTLLGYMSGGDYGGRASGAMFGGSMYVIGGSERVMYRLDMDTLELTELEMTLPEDIESITSFAD
ncbi:MAG: IPT/TIG domain-containing protein [Alphaproteobacteria bacterium]|nr:IPT/TIG domain-containing protein [Alphaproteobacteria bacterium]